MAYYGFSCTKLDLHAEVALRGGTGVVAKSGLPLGTLDGAPFELKVIPAELVTDNAEEGSWFYIP
jgi:hypothetical protein